MSQQPPMSRRRALGVTALGVSAPVFAACGSDSDASGSDPATSDAPATPSETSEAAAEEPTSESAEAPVEGLVAASEVPVSSGVILSDEQVVVTQPAEGEFKGFTAICTHAQCVVTSIDTDIMCGCHGSRFAIADGSVVNGPASSPLAEVGVTVTDGQVVRS